MSSTTETFRAVARRVWPAAKLALWVLGSWLLVCALIVSFIEIQCRGGVAADAAAFRAPPRSAEVAKVAAEFPDYARPEADTYLSYPEWYIVWSYEEKAAYQKLHLPSGFPFYGAIGQYWSNYCSVNRLVQGRYPFSPGDHLMLVVIGTSFTVEYALKGLYEKTVGKFTELVSHHEQVEEDRYAYSVARQYADFTLVRPFYEFSFLKAFAGLWTGPSLWGRSPLRKLERRVFLSVDYLVESFYCELIELATRALYGLAGSDTYAWIEPAPPSVFAANPHMRNVKTLPAEVHVVVIPRYQEFTPTAFRLIHSGVRFREIAGNAGEIVISGVVPRLVQYDLAPAQQLFSSVLLTQPGLKRIVVRAPVQALQTVLPKLQSQRISVEHIYDY